MEKQKKKAIPIGYEDFKEIIDKNLYFIDKSLLIEELLESNMKVTLITRPRRFGKTLNLSMIRRFFEDERTSNGEKIENGYLFDGLALSRCEDGILRHQQQYPVINLSLKSGKQPDFEMAYKSLVDEVAKEFNRHCYVLQSDMILQSDKVRYEAIMTRGGEPAEYAKALAFLSECLAKYHQQKVIILIDEYDVPLEHAYSMGFYDEMIGFIRSLFESALKTNDFLEWGVITGCLRISRESIFTGLNNLRVYSLLSNQYCDKFGFTAEEVQTALDYYGLLDKYPVLQEWYDGYRFGTAEIYNPWSILCYMDDARNEDFMAKPYWSNTSSNSIIRDLVAEADNETRKELEILMDGGFIEKPIHEDITYGDIHKSQDNLWNFLFFTGYLKAGEKRQVNEAIYLTMSIPNWEIKSIYRNSISEWFKEKIRKTDNNPLLRALEEGDCETASRFLSRQLMGTISYFDYNESYYHGYLTGIFAKTEDYELESNQESGLGRPDIVLSTENILNGEVIILELKVAATIHEMEDKCREALRQIDEQRYAEPFEIRGYKKIQKYAVCFCRKDCIVRKAE